MLKHKNGATHRKGSARNAESIRLEWCLLFSSLVLGETLLPFIKATLAGLLTHIGAHDAALLVMGLQ
jgi:hypothetical protein